MPTAQITGVRYNGEGCYELETGVRLFPRPQILFFD